MSDKTPKKDALTNPNYHDGSSKIKSVGRVSHDSSSQKKALSETSHHAMKGQAGHAQPNPPSDTDRQPSPISSRSGAHTASRHSGRTSISAAMDRWQRETPQEQYWNSEGYYAKK